jgi:hypothetical protein
VSVNWGSSGHLSIPRVIYEFREPGWGDADKKNTNNS